jgi:hypothetical protein
MHKQLDKKQFAIKIRLFINHKRVLEKYSKHYKKYEVAKSMRECYRLFQLVKRNCLEYSMESLCKMVIQNEQHLRNIMPNANNSSFETQQKKLELIITTAKTFQYEHSNRS